MRDPVRLVNRGGLGSELLRAGSEERPSGARLRRAMSTMGAAAAASSLAGEAAGGGAGAAASGALGSVLAKASSGSISVAVAAKWMGIGGLSALLAVGATGVAGRAHEPMETRGAPTSTADTLERAARSKSVSAFPSTVEATELPAGVAGLPVPTGTVAPHERALDVGVSPAGAEVRDLSRSSGAERAAPVGAKATIDSKRAPGSSAASSPNIGGERASLAPVAAISPESSAPSPTAGSPEPSPTAVSVAPSSQAFAAGSTDGPSSALPQRGAATALRTAEAAAPSVDSPLRTSVPSEPALRLAKEVSFVDSAWGAMKRGDPAKALADLADYEQKFPERGLHPEVLFVRMEAEDRLGHGAAAKLEAQRILSSYPRSAQAGRAIALLRRP